MKAQKYFFIGYLFIFIFAFACCHKNSNTPETPKEFSPRQAEESPTEYLLLRFQFRQDSVTLKKVKKYTGKVPLVSQKLDGEDYQLLLLDSQEKKLFVYHFQAPGKRYYDQLDSTGKNLSGGEIIIPESILELKIPFFKNLQTLKMISPQQKIIWQTSRGYIMEAIKD